MNGCQPGSPKFFMSAIQSPTGCVVCSMLKGCNPCCCWKKEQPLPRSATMTVDVCTIGTKLINFTSSCTFETRLSLAHTLTVITVLTCHCNMSPRLKGLFFSLDVKASRAKHRRCSKLQSHRNSTGSVCCLRTALFRTLLPFGPPPAFLSLGVFCEYSRDISIVASGC